jgi:ABC-type multidrug transport system ATPase subunit
MTPRSLEAAMPDAPPCEADAAQEVVSLAHEPPNRAPLAVSGVTKRWGNDKRPLLDGLDLTLDPGTVTWVGGRNGAGKTTMLRIVAGLIEPEQGRSEVWGVTVHENRVLYQTLVSFLPAGDRGLYARLTVRRQLEFWARISLTPRAQVSQRVGVAIEAFDLKELADRRVDRLSMGQRQRLRIAMTFLTHPEIVLLDEPLTSLDAEGTAFLLHGVQQVVARGGVVLWCSPTGEHLDVKFDTRWVLDRGRLAPA